MSPLKDSKRLRHSATSTHLEASSTHSDSVIYTQGLDPQLLEIAAPVRNKGKTSQEQVRLVVLELCKNRFLTIQQLGAFLNRAPAGLRERYIKPMILENLLDRRFPLQPNHEDQAYRTHE